LGFAAPLEDYTDLRYGVQWRVNDSVSLSLQAFYEHLVEKGTLVNDEVDRIGGIFSLAFRVTQRASVALFYTYIRKDSNLPLQDYHQNVYGLELRHSF
jgi:hypothetical protein